MRPINKHKRTSERGTIEQSSKRACVKTRESTTLTAEMFPPQLFKLGGKCTTVTEVKMSDKLRAIDRGQWRLRLVKAQWKRQQHQLLTSTQLRLFGP